ncbi:hypothetical protein [Alicyclobacillus contaminans]|uniref:hypothetical protein n=1 Tax=Alicyclobacillus contaminans TaxID=392016 RepID=UPI000403CD1D|nr:hypothetical protein [Alicyclobacillus contaminans]
MKTGATVITVATAMVVLVGAGTGVGYYAWQHHQEVLNMEAAQARQDYRNNLLLTAADLTKDAEDANSVTDEISQIWHDAIFNDFGVDVHGTYASTFDDAFQDESQYLESQGTLDRLTSEDTQIQDQISKLNSPPSRF